MLITDQQINQYIQSGAVLLDNVLPEAVINEASLEMDNLYAQSDDKTGIKAYLSQDGFVNLFQDPNLEQVAKQILGCEAVHILSSATLHTVPTEGPWSYEENSEHVDIQYMLSDWLETPRRIIVTFMVFLDDIPADRAPTLIRPGSHLQLAAQNTDHAFQEKPVFKHDLPKLDYAPMQPVCGKKGQIAVSTTALIHAGSKNTSDKPRKMLFAVYAASDVNPAFNANRLPARLEWLETLEQKFKPERKHLAATAVASTRKLLADYEQSQLQMA